jgi:transcriptional regulator with XRE-family HTH domain
VARKRKTPIADEVGLRIKEIRDAEGWTVDDLADRLRDLQQGSWRDAVSRVEGGKRGLSVDELFLFAVALGVSPLALLPQKGDVTLLDNLRLPAPIVIAWMQGKSPLRREDLDTYTRHRWEPWPKIWECPELLVDHVLGDEDRRLPPDEKEALRAFLLMHEQFYDETIENIKGQRLLGEDDEETLQKLQAGREAIRALARRVANAPTGRPPRQPSRQKEKPNA